MAGLSMAAGCGAGSKGAGAGKPAGTPAQAAAQAKAACHAVTDLKPGGKTVDAQAQHAKDVAAGFATAARLAKQAAATDSRWAVLAASAEKEAKAFAVIAAAAGGAASLDQQAVLDAAAQTRAQQPIFITQCQRAEGVAPAVSSTATP